MQSALMQSALMQSALMQSALMQDAISPYARRAFGLCYMVQYNQISFVTWCISDAKILHLKEGLSLQLIPLRGNCIERK